MTGGASAADEPAAPPIARLGERPIVVIGLGGIGVPVAHALARFLTSAQARTTMFLVDGDAFEDRNRARVAFSAGGNKALSVARELGAICDGGGSVVPVPLYVTPYNARRVIERGSIVMLAVDNHATRRCVSARCARVPDVLLVSGGNDAADRGRTGTFGSVMVYERAGGRSLGPPPTRYHPEIAHPSDRRPDEIGCAALAAAAAPQLLFTNLAVASAMLGVFYGWLMGRAVPEEVYLDIAAARMNPVLRRAARGRR